MLMNTELPVFSKLWSGIFSDGVTESPIIESTEDSEELRRQRMRRELTELFQDQLNSDFLSILKERRGQRRAK